MLLSKNLAYLINTKTYVLLWAMWSLNIHQLPFPEALCLIPDASVVPNYQWSPGLNTLFTPPPFTSRLNGFSGLSVPSLPLRSHPQSSSQVNNITPFFIQLLGFIVNLSHWVATGYWPFILLKYEPYICPKKLDVEYILKDQSPSSPVYHEHKLLWQLVSQLPSSYYWGIGVI